MTENDGTYGRVMSLDLGEKRIGIAISDPARIIASPHMVMKRKSRADDFARYAQLIQDQDVNLIVIGLPITLAGHEGQRSAWVRDYAEALGRAIDTPIVFWDESLTTVAAIEALQAQGRRGKKLKDRVDAVAAALILQSYLDANEGIQPYGE